MLGLLNIYKLSADPGHGINDPTDRSGAVDPSSIDTEEDVVRWMLPLITTVIIALPAAAQWGWLESPMSGQVTQMERLPSGGLLLGTTGGLFASTDGGSSWFFTGLGSNDDPNAGNDIHFDAYEDDNGDVYVAMENLYKGSTALNDFVYQYLAPPVYGVESIEKWGDTWIISSALEIWRSTDDLETFEDVFDDSGIWDDIVGLHTNPVDGTFIAHMERAGGIWLLVSEDDGQTWVEQQMTGVFGDMEPPVFAPDGRLYFAHNYQNQGYVRYTDDYGVTSTVIYDGDDNFEVADLVYGGDSNLAVMRGAGVLVSENLGGAWSFYNDPDFRPEALCYDGNTLLAGCEDGVRGTVTYTDWDFSDDGLACVQLTDAELSGDGDGYLIGSGFAWGQLSGNWGDLPTISDISGLRTTIHETSSGRLLVFGRLNSGGAAFGYYSDNGGASWTAVSGLSGGSWGDFFNVLELSDNHLLVSHSNLGILESNDDGASWSTFNASVSGQLGVTGDGDFYALNNGTFQRSTDGGTSWESITDLFGVEAFATSPTSSAVVAIDFTSTSILTDEGTWEDLYNSIWPALPGEYFVRGTGVAFSADGTLYLAVEAQDQSTGRYRTAMLSSSDDGATFTVADTWSNIRNAVVQRLRPAASGDVLALTNMGVYVSGLVADVEEDERRQAALPARFSLAQNYPNPFNPSTSIAFSLPVSSHASLVVYDLLGREVTRMLGGRVSAGQHTVTLDASSWSSGVYLYTLTAGNHQQTRRMTLVK